MQNKTFYYLNWAVRASSKGWLYKGNRYPYALDTYGFEVYFKNKQEAKEYIDKYVGGFNEEDIVKNFHQSTGRKACVKRAEHNKEGNHGH